MTRLDMFLKHTGLIKQRSQAKRACDDGRVVLVGPSGEKTAKASQAVHVGEQVRIETMTRRIEVKYAALPSERQRAASASVSIAYLTKSKLIPSQT